MTTASNAHRVVSAHATSLSNGTTAVKLAPPTGMADSSTDLKSRIAAKAAPRFTVSDSEGRMVSRIQDGTPLVLDLRGGSPGDLGEQLQKSAPHVHDHADVFVIQRQDR